MKAIAYRRATEADFVFVVQSWLDSYRTAHAAGMIAMERWYLVMEPEVRAVLARPLCTAWVAHNPGGEQGSDVYGWLALELGEGPPLVFYVYVKHPYRRMGIAAGLLAHAGVDVTREWHYACRTAVCAKLALGRARWTPLTARFPPGDRAIITTREEQRHGEDR